MGSTTFNDKRDLQIDGIPSALLRMDLKEPNEESQNEDIIRPTYKSTHGRWYKVSLSIPQAIGVHNVVRMVEGVRLMA
jgi:hypothetical protein